MDRLNYHHLHYFWAVARDGNLTRTARQLRVSQSALSAQIRQLEDELGAPLFVREGRRLALSEAGRVALGYADDIFAAGSELVSTIKRGRTTQHVLRVGAVATLSRNFQESFIKPVLDQPDVRLSLQSGNLEALLRDLSDHALDIVLANRAPQRAPGRSWRCRRVASQVLSLVGRKRRASFRFPDDLRGEAMIVPGVESEVRAEFEALCEQLDLRVKIVAEVDDMATMRLLARDTGLIALLPSVVVRDELSSRVLHEYCVVPGLRENFFAITVARHYQHPVLRALLTRDEGDILAMGRAPAPRGAS